jgi:hypothetical protein
VDLNPIRAAIAETIEDSDFTSAQKNAAGLRGEFSVADDAGLEDEINILKLSSGGRDTGDDERELTTVGSIPSAERRVYGTRGNKESRHLVMDFGKLFRVVAGQPQRIAVDSLTRPAEYSPLFGPRFKTAST